MSREELKVKHVHELSTKMLNSAIYVIYQDHRPQQTIFCNLWRRLLSEGRRVT